MGKWEGKFKGQPKEQGEQQIQQVRHLPPPLPQIQRIHLMGIGGVGMASLAGLLQSRGLEVTGSDSEAGIYPPMSDFLKKLGIPVQKGYHPSNLNLDRKLDEKWMRN